MKELFCCMFCGLERADVEHENDACADCAKEAWRAAYERDEATPLDQMAEEAADRLQRMRDVSRAAAPLAAELAAIPSKIGATIPRFPGIVYHSPRVILEAERDAARAELDAKIPDLEADAAERERLMRVHAINTAPSVALAIDRRHVQIKLQLIQRRELAARVDALDAMIASAVEEVRPHWMSAEDARLAISSLRFDGLDAEREASMLARSAAALRALDEQSEALEACCMGCENCIAPEEAEEASSAPRELELDEEARAALVGLEEELEALDAPREGEAPIDFHRRAALTLIAQHIGADEEDVVEEIGEALDHLVHAAEIAAVERVERLMVDHHRQLGAALHMVQRAATAAALEALQAAAGGAAAAVRDPHIVD